MAKEPIITVVGNLTADPELRYTPSGVPVARFTVAQTPSSFNKSTNSWEDGETIFMVCNVWRTPAENGAESLRKGMAVIATGRLRSKSWEAKDGQKRTSLELEVDAFGPDLSRATANVTKNPPRNQGGGDSYGGQNRPAANTADAPF